MTDNVSPAVRSRIMAAVNNKNTKPEIAVRRALHAAGYRFRLHRSNLPGHPDLILPGYRTEIFVHGCYWHGHSCRRRRLPSSNVQFLEAKISRTIGRDTAAADVIE
ncbi:DNA mismatch endonuclease vsr [Rhodopseudomonas palustris BisB18]|uniref:DNA mismatch endonuclease vsr n=2 Tax=Rhodopseudomonas palustris TaxID=1076 RepID=Q20YF6_RHOPB